MENTSLAPEFNAEIIAQKKLDTYLNIRNDPFWALSADTFLYFKGKIIGKPSDRKNAEEILKSLSGDIHKVITGFCIKVPKKKDIIISHTVTDVYFKKLDKSTINWYLNQNEWHDAAGSYKIQCKGSILVEKINGSYSNVVGLPIEAIYAILKQYNYPF